MSLFCDVRIGELLKELPKAKNQYDRSSATTYKQTKTQAIQDTGIDRDTANKLEKLSQHVDIVEAVIDDCEEKGADIRIGELLRELPRAKGNQYKRSASVGMPTKAEAERESRETKK